MDRNLHPHLGSDHLNQHHLNQEHGLHLDTDQHPQLTSPLDPNRRPLDDERQHFNQLDLSPDHAPHLVADHLSDHPTLDPHHLELDHHHLDPVHLEPDHHHLDPGHLGSDHHLDPDNHLHHHEVSLDQDHQEPEVWTCLLT